MQKMQAAQDQMRCLPNKPISMLTLCEEELKLYIRNNQQTNRTCQDCGHGGKVVVRSRRVEICIESTLGEEVEIS